MTKGGNARSAMESVALIRSAAPSGLSPARSPIGSARTSDMATATAASARL